MASDRDAPDTTESIKSTDTSLTGTRSPSKRFEPITRDNDNGDEEESSETPGRSGTVRRKRPPAISTASSTNYGSNLLSQIKDIV